MSELDLSKYEGHHESKANPGTCICGDPWPCAPSELLEEVRRLRENATAYATALVESAHQIAALRQSHARLLTALREITEGAGPFSRDPLTHAANTIDAMKALARAAVAEAEGL